MVFTFKPFFIDTNSYYGNVMHDLPCNENTDTQKYNNSFKRAIDCLTDSGNHSLSDVLNKLTRDKNSININLPTFSFENKPKEASETLFQFLIKNNETSI